MFIQFTGYWLRTWINIKMYDIICFDCWCLEIIISKTKNHWNHTMFIIIILYFFKCTIKTVYNSTNKEYANTKTMEYDSNLSKQTKHILFTFECTKLFSSNPEKCYDGHQLITEKDNIKIIFNNSKIEVSLNCKLRYLTLCWTRNKVSNTDIVIVSC